jgi:hypothetical protein
MKGRVAAEWLQSFDGLAEIHLDESPQTEDRTVVDVRADQSGIVGLVRRLHGLGVTILQVQVVAGGGGAAEGEAPRESKDR